MNSFRKKIKFLFVLIGIINLCLLGTITLQAQAQIASPAIMAQVTAELQKRGLTESEVRVRLLQKGIDLENIPPAELPQYQAKVMAVLDELQAEKKAAKNAEQPVLNSTQLGNSKDTLTPKLVAPKTTQQEAAADASQRVIKSAAAKKEGAAAIYGHSLFVDQSLDVFRTTDGSQAPETYILGEGDEVRITIFGASQTDILQKVAQDGSIQPSGGAKIFLKGLSLAQAREVIRERLSSAYTFRADQLAVTILTARTIMVNVFGEAKITGGFNLSALNSAFNALSAAGGPTAIGSVRDIQLIRGNTRKSIDLYAFMNNPATQFKFDLQNNDILFVPVIKLLVSIEGAVNRPMFYEMLPDESLIDLLQYAGGVKKDVFPNFVQIKRYINGEERLEEWNLEEVRSGKIKVPLLNGDVIHIKSIGKPMDNYVDVEGSVYYPGRYNLTTNPTLSKVLENAKPNYQAKTDLLFIERMKPDSTEEVLTVPFPNQAAGNEFTLQPRDRIRVMNQASYRDIDTIAVNGFVRKPFKKTFGMQDHLTVKQAIELAGGVKSSVYPVAYIFRRNMFNRLEMKYIRIELSQSDNIELQPGDQLNIYDNTSFTNIGAVRVFGAVKNPRTFTYDPTLTVRDVLTNAEGMTVGAAFNRVEIFRTVLSPTEKTSLTMITIEVDSAYQVVSPKNFTLQPYDQVVVRLTPEFTLGRTVEINGQVEYPGTYVLKSKQTQLSEVIKMAGGLLDAADPHGSRLFRTYRNRGDITTNVHKRMGQSGNIKDDPILFEGDVININRLENTVSIFENGTRMAQYSIRKDNNEFKNVVFQGKKSAGWYIRNYAGGFQQRANRSSVTITLPNDQMIGTKHLLLLFHRYPHAFSGSMITMQMKPPKEKPVDGKKVDWDSALSRTTQSLTAVLTLYLLINQLAK